MERWFHTGDDRDRCAKAAICVERNAVTLLQRFTHVSDSVHGNIDLVDVGDNVDRGMSCELEWYRWAQREHDVCSRNSRSYLDQFGAAVRRGIEKVCEECRARGIEGLQTFEQNLWNNLPKMHSLPG